MNAPGKIFILKYLPPVLGILVLGGVIIGLHRALKHLRWGDVAGALAATPGFEILHALLLLAGSVLIMMVYDLPGVYFARKLAPLPKLSSRRIALASFCAYALSHVLGAPSLSGAAIRLRLYAQWQVSGTAIARIVAVSGSMFALGFATLLGFLLLLDPLDVPLFGHSAPLIFLRGAGLALGAGVVFYVTFAQARPDLSFFGRRIALPGSGIALAQVVLSCLDTGTAAAILFVLLPDTPGLGYQHVLGIYLAAFAGGLVSGLPGGVGVFDSLLLLGLAQFLSPATALGAILLFRLLYFLAPAATAGLCYAIQEILLNTRREDTKK